MKMKFHKFHMVTPSPWPVTNSIMMFNLMSSITYLLIYNNNKLTIIMMSMTMITMMLWWKDVIRESLMQGQHQQIVMNSLKMGMIMFIMSEMMLFTSFFWAYFHSSLNPSMEIGMIWPPMSINSFNPINVPLLNTIILISSGISITWSHHMLMTNNKKESLKSMLITLMLGMTFSMLQIMEYMQSNFSMPDSVYGSTFFLSTGFHGMHVLIGTMFLLTCYMRMNKNSMSSNHMISFEMAAWYWHFVDIVWLFLYLSIYWWSY
uniref:Cytochrome c oxidase subunit 3 n=1 Tax=Riccardoella tokyoensis TaxID=2073164 RepID=A0A7R7UNE8_9ACAR|nr:cytochrome oxidase subunit 3 [Riccardoella tokyoensis]